MSRPKPEKVGLTGPTGHLFSSEKRFIIIPGVLVHYNLYTRGRGDSAILLRDMALGPIGPTSSSLLTQMSSSNMVILSIGGHTFDSLDRAHII